MMIVTVFVIPVLEEVIGEVASGLMPDDTIDPLMIPVALNMIVSAALTALARGRPLRARKYMSKETLDKLKRDPCIATLKRPGFESVEVIDLQGTVIAIYSHNDRSRPC